MPKISKKEIKLKIVQSGSSVCRASPYVIDLKKVYAKEEKILTPKKENLFISSLKDLSFIGPLYFLISLIFRFLKSPIKVSKKFFVFFGSCFINFFQKFAAAAKNLRKFRISPQPILSKFKILVSKFKWPVSISLPAGWSRRMASFLVVSFILISPFQALSYYSHFQNKLDKLGLNLVDVLKLLPQKKGLEKALLISNIGKKILGYGEEKRYLVIFQNSNEIRPTGGFLGSFALVDVLNGKIKKMEIPPEGSYALEGCLRENVIAPEPLHLVSSRWEFQDANWFPDFPTSAEKIIWFYNKSGGPSVDGVIALTSDFFKNILKVSGPIEMSDYGKVINSENFDSEIQKTVEIEYDKKENKPKQIIADLAPKIIDKILGSDNQQFADLVNILNQELTEKDLLFYFKDKEIQNAILNLGWAGEIKDVEKESDYLMMVDTNIAGEKTDAVIHNQIYHSASIKDDGSIVDQVTITKTHQGKEGELFTGVRNVDYLRIYVPKGSVLLEAKGFEIPPQELFKKPEDYLKPDADLTKIEGKTLFDEASGTTINTEFDKTVFGNWVLLDPGETKTVSFTYELPFKISFDESAKNIIDNLKENLGFSKKETVFYNFFAQKQPGSKTEIVSEVKFPDDWRPIWRYPENLQIKDSAWLAQDELSVDHFYGALFEIKK